MNHPYNPIKGILFLLGIFLLTAIPALAQQGQLQGTVTGQEQAEPIPGINVGLQGTTFGAATDSEGQFLIERIPAGTYIVQITGVGYKSLKREVTIQEGRNELLVELPRDVLGMNEVVISATRSAETLDEVPASVNVLNQDEINDELAISTNLSDMLAKQVPGFAQSTESSSNWGQNLRGRNYLVLVNGIPQSTPLRAVSRDLQSIDAGAVSRIEVIKGATAIYGNGATGGLINYITALPQTNGFQSVTEVGTNVSLSSPSNSQGYRFSQQLMGRSDRFSYTFSGSFEQNGLFKDASGDIIPTDPHGQGGLSSASIYNLHAQMGYDFNARHQIEVMYNFYSNDQESDYVTVAGSYPGRKARAAEGDAPGVTPGTRGNHNARANYRWLNIFGETSMEATAFLQDYETYFGYYEGYRGGGQSYLNAQKKGLRLNLDSPFQPAEHIQGSLVYGADLLSDNTAQLLVDGRTLTPRMEMTSYAPYAQLKAIFYDHWVLKGGLRYEDIQIDVPDYTTVEQLNPSGGYSGGVDIEGGSLNYQAFTYNLGLSYARHNAFNPFVSFSQGFSVADLGRTLRSATEATTVQRIDPEPVIVQNYELGFNSSFRRFRGSLAGFASTSDLGTSYQENASGDLIVARAPEIVYGVEVSAHFRPTEKLRLGGTYTFTEGRADIDDNGNYTNPEDEFLVNSRISPPKVTAYADYRFTSRLKAKVSMLHSGERDRFERVDGGGYAAYKNNITGYMTLDVSSTYKLPFGSFSLAVKNLLNADYYPAISQWAGAAYATGYSKAQGARLNATLKVQL